MECDRHQHQAEDEEDQAKLRVQAGRLGRVRRDASPALFFAEKSRALIRRKAPTPAVASPARNPVIILSRRKVFMNSPSSLLTHGAP
jgi:hypothetical protein